MTDSFEEPPRDASLWAKMRYEYALWRRPKWEFTYAERTERRILIAVGRCLLGAGLVLIAMGPWPALRLAAERILQAGLAFLLILGLYHGFGGSEVFHIPKWSRLRRSAFRKIHAIKRR